MQTARSIDLFSRMLASGGPEAALQYLNSGVPHRYTAVYRFDGQLLRNVVLHDKRGQLRPDYLIAIPFEQSFCQFVRRGQAFRTDDSATDERLVGHPYRGVVVSYHSVPIANERGAIWGTMSHFDMASRALLEPEFELLELAAKAFGRHIPRMTT